MMKKTLILLVLVIPSLCNSYSQGYSYSESDKSQALTISELSQSNPYQETYNTESIPQGTDSILMKKSRYYYQGKPIKTVMEINRIMKPNREAFTKHQTAWLFQCMAAPCAVFGGFFIGGAIGKSIGSGEKVNMKMVGIGAGLVAVGIPLAIISDKMRRESIRIYNRDLGKTSLYPEKELKIKLMANGIGVNYRF